VCLYRLDLAEVLGWYGISSGQIPADAQVIPTERTHLIGFRPEEGNVQVPIALDPGLDLTRTTFLSRLIQQWGTVPLTLLTNLDLRNYRYGLMGTEDWSMCPLIPPGSLVVIDDSKRRVATSGWSTEYDRPIYFLSTAKVRLRMVLPA